MKSKSMEHKELFKELRGDKIKINQNRNPIPMELFISFLTIDVFRSENFLGESNGWTQLENKEHQLEIRGGFVDGKEWLDTIQYGKNLDNVWNNFVNPFYLFGIMNKKGIDFFLAYYNEDIKGLLSKSKRTIEHLDNEIKKEVLRRREIQRILKELKNG